jgi:GNAT superfamily N-acetyltransferase
VTCEVRAAGADDARAIEDVRVASWRATYGSYLPAHVWDEIDAEAAAARRAAQLASGRVFARVAEVDGTVRGYALFGPCRDPDLADAGELYAIYADPDHWSTGLGRALLRAVLDTLSARPVALWVLEQNAHARRFYEIAGFRPDGRRKPAELLGGVQLPEIRYRLD